MYSYTIIDEPTDGVYQRLLRWLSKLCTTVTIVIRPEEDLEEHGQRVLQHLRPWLREQRVTMEWPGTRLLEGSARLCIYNLSPEVLDILCAEATSLYAWAQPELPEDLCFLRESDAVLVTISHEKDGYLLLDDYESQGLREELPELSLRIDDNSGDSPIPTFQV